MEEAEDDEGVVDGISDGKHVGSDIEKKLGGDEGDHDGLDLLEDTDGKNEGVVDGIENCVCVCMCVFVCECVCV